MRERHEWVERASERGAEERVYSRVREGGEGGEGEK